MPSIAEVVAEDLRRRAGGLDTSLGTRLIAPAAAAPSATAVTPGQTPPTDLTPLGQLVAQFGPWTMKREPGFSNMPANYGKGVLGVGPALTAAVIGVARETPTVLEAARPEGAEARVRLLRDVTDLSKTVAAQALDAAKHPLRTLQQFPFELTPVVGGGLTLAAKGARAAGAVEGAAGVANAIEKAAYGVGAVKVPGADVAARTLEGAANLTRSLRPAIEAVAQEGPYRPAARAAQAALEKAVPPYGYYSDQARAWMALQRLQKSARDITFISQNKNFRYFHKFMSGLDEAGMDEWARVMAGQIPRAEASTPVLRVLMAWDAVPGQVQAEWIALGKLRPDVARRAAYQPMRMEEFGRQIPVEIRKAREVAEMERNVAAGEIKDLIAAAARHGGAGGTIQGEMMTDLAKWLRARAKQDPTVPDPMALARDIWERMAPRLADRGLYPSRYLGDFNKALERAKKGTYVEATAPLFHQIEGIVKGAIEGKEVPFPKGLLEAAPEAVSGVQATSREVARALADPKLRAKINAVVVEGATEAELEVIAQRLAGQGAPPDIVEKIVNGLHSGKLDLDEDLLARIIQSDERLRIRAGQVIEARLKTDQSNAFEPPQPSMSQMVRNPMGRRIHQMTRAEWEALPETVRMRKVPQALREATDPYGASVAWAIRKSFKDSRYAVPREVLAQNPDWQMAALSKPSQRLEAVTRELAQAVVDKGVDEPMYFPNLLDPAHFPERAVRSGFRLGEHFRPTSLKVRHGATYASGDFWKNPAALSVKVTNDLLKYQEAERIIDGIIKDPRMSRPIKSAGDVRPGETAWSPDGLRLWRAEIDMAGRVVGGIREAGVDAEAVEMSIAQAMARTVKDNAFTEVARGFRKPKLYAVRSSVVGHLQAAMKQSSPWIAALYDAPTGIWRMSVLALRPAWISNNIMGNVTFSLLHGVAPRHYIMALQERYRAKTPDNLNGIQLTSSEAEIGQLLAGAPNNLWNQFIYWLNDQPAQVNVGALMHGNREARVEQAGRILDPRRVTQPLARTSRAMTDFNQAVESFFRTANFYKVAEKAARRQYVTRTGDSFLKAFNLLDEMDSLPPAAIEQAVAATNKFMHDYNALLPFERSFIRRAFPFYNFMKFQTRLLMGLPLDYPGRYVIMQGMVAVGRDVQAYDNSQLPEWARDKGLADTGYDWTVNDAGGKPHRLRAFYSSTGWNPFIFGYSPASTAALGIAEVAKGVAQTVLSQTNPLLKWPVNAIRPGFDIQSGIAKTAPGIIEQKGKFYDVEKVVRGVPPGQAGAKAPAEYMAYPWLFAAPYVSTAIQTPQVQLLRHLARPGAAYTGNPLSLEDSKDVPTRTRLLDLLRYLTSANIVLIDQDRLDAPPMSLTDMKTLLIRASLEHDSRTRRQAIRKAQEGQTLKIAPPDTSGRARP